MIMMRLNGKVYRRSRRRVDELEKYNIQLTNYHYLKELEFALESLVKHCKPFVIAKNPENDTTVAVFVPMPKGFQCVGEVEYKPPRPEDVIYMSY